MTDAPSSSLAASRIGFVAAFTVLAAMTIVALVPEQWPIVAAMSVTEGLPLVAWLLAASGFGHLVMRAGPFSVRDADSGGYRGGDAPALIVVTRIALGLGAMSLLTLLVGLAGILRQPVAIAMLVIGCALAIRHIYTNRATTSAWLHASPGASWLLLLLAPVFAITFLGTCILPGVLWGLDDPSGYDVVAYHLQLPREWYDLGRVTTLRHNVFSFFPLNVEMHYLIAMHLRGGPWAGMYLAQLMHGALVALTLAAVYGFARRRGRPAATVATLVCASVPWMYMLGSVAYVEGGLMLYTTLAAGWAMRGRWVLAGVCAGLACGSKLTGVPVSLIIAASVGCVALWTRRKTKARSDADLRSEISDFSGPPSNPLPKGEGAAARPFEIIRGLTIFGVVALLVFSPWLIRTAIASGGNPIFPLALRTLGHGHFDQEQVERFEIAHSPRGDQRSLPGRLQALWQQVGGDYHYGSIAIGERFALPLWLLLIVPATVLAHRDREARIWLLIVAGNIAIWLFATHLQGRFLVQVIPCVAMLVACAIRPLEGGSPCRLVGTEGTDQRHGVTPSRVFAGIAIVVALVSLIGSSRTPIATLLRTPSGAFGVTDAAQLRGLLPSEELAAAVYDTDRPIALLGDAKAFWYAIPSSRLHYRSVFDVGSNGFRDGWLGADVPADAIVSPDFIELTRFYRTYRRLPEGYDKWDVRSLGPVIRVEDVPR